MAEYDSHEGYVIDRINVKYNENRLGVGTSAATIDYHYPINGHVIYTTDELGNEEVELALKRFVSQSGKTRDELKKEGRLFIRDFEEDRQKERDQKKRKMIKITSLFTAAVIGVTSLGYILSKKSVSAEKQPDTYQSILYNADNELSQYITIKTQMLYQNVYELNNRHSIKKDGAYNYCMYVTNLIMGGDDITNDVGKNETLMSNVKYVVKNSHIASYENDVTIINFANEYNTSQRRIAYAATPQEAYVFSKLPIETRRAIIEQFMEVFEDIQFEFKGSIGNVQKSDYPSWLVEHGFVYNHQMLMEKVNEYIKSISNSNQTGKR